MASKLETDAVEPQSGTTLTLGAAGDTVDLSTATVTLPADTVGTSQIAANAVGNSEMATTLDLSGKTVTLPSASVTAHVIPFDDNQLKEEIALLGFRTAANGSLAKYNLVDQTIDAFEDASGVDASASTGETRNASNYYSGSTDSVTTVYTDSLSENGTGWANYSSRQLFDNFSAGGTKIRVDIKGGSTGTALDNVAIVPRSGNTFNGTTTPTELLFSSSSGVTIAADATVTSDWLTFTSTASNDYLGILDFSNSGGDSVGYTSTGQAGGAYTANTNSYNSQNFSAGTSGTFGVGFSKVEVSTLAISNLTLVSNATTAEAVPTKGDLVLTYSDGAGTATVNTDLKAYASRDDGTTWTQLTLASQGSTGAHTILSAHDLDISGQPSGTDMRYKITTHNQSVTKETRVHAVSLGWS